MEVLIIGALIFLVLQTQNASANMASAPTGAGGASGTGVGGGTNSITSPVTGTGGAYNSDAPYFSGSLSDAFVQASTKCGVFPTVLQAIVQHETGNYSSSLWQTANNPGGLKYQPSAFYGMSWGYVLANDDSPGEKFGRFPTQGEGVCALGRFLSQSRYNAARTTTSPQGQINAIAAAGYATDPTWPRQVWAMYQTLAQTSPDPVQNQQTELNTIANAGTTLLGSAVSANYPDTSTTGPDDFTLPDFNSPTPDVGLYSSSDTSSDDFQL